MKYDEAFEYTKLEGLTILGEEADAKKWALSVGPNDTNIVILEAGSSGFGMAGAGYAPAIVKAS